MQSHELTIWALLLAGSALCGWWLAVRPGASLRGVASPISCLIILMAALLAAMAISHSGGGPRAAQAQIAPATPAP